MKNITSSIICAFVGDAVSLGPHWIYDTRIIEKNFPSFEEITSPLENSYHPNKTAGDFTHYGDQMIFLLENLAEHHQFTPEVFANEWKEKMIAYDGYKDFASKKTLKNLESGGTWRYSGSSSDELGGLARFAPLILLYHTNLSELQSAIRAQTQITHNSPKLLVIGDFFAELIFQIIEGNTIEQSIQNLKANNNYKMLYSQYINPVIKHLNNATRIEIKRFGQMCSSKNAFPSIIHLLLKYEDKPEEGMIENIKAGGDNAARGIIYGLFMGLKHGIDWVPKQWLNKIKQKNRIEELIKETV